MTIIFRTKEEYGRSKTRKGSSAPWVGIREFVQCLKSDLAQDEVSKTRSRLAGAILSIVFNLRRERVREPGKSNDNPDSGSSILAFVLTINQTSNSVLKIKGRHGNEVQYDPQDVGRQEEREAQVGAPITVEVPHTPGVHGPYTRYRGKSACPSGIRTRYGMNQPCNRVDCKADSFHTDYLSILRKKLYIYALWLLQSVTQHRFLCTQCSQLDEKITIHEMSVPCSSMMGEFQGQSLYWCCAEKSSFFRVEH